MARPLKPRVLYDLEVQQLLRVQNAVTLDHDIDNELHPRLTEALSLCIRVLRDLSAKRRPRSPSVPPGKVSVEQQETPATGVPAIGRVQRRHRLLTQRPKGKQ